MQRDLHVMFNTVGLSAFGPVSVCFVPAFAPVRRLVVAWLVLFAAIGIYQRTRMTWPQPLPADPGSGVSTSKFLVTSLAVIAVAVGLHVFTGKMTTRAAADFQRAFDKLPPPGRDWLQVAAKLSEASRWSGPRFAKPNSNRRDVEVRKSSRRSLANRQDWYAYSGR
jgi:hypothetical protein